MMTLSIRTRLTVLIALVFFSVLLIIMAGGIFALYIGLVDELDSTLNIERKILIETLKSDFGNLLDVTDTDPRNPEDDLVVDIDEMVQYKREFIIVSINTPEKPRIFTDTRHKNILARLPESLLLQEGKFNHVLDGKRYRILISKPSWGMLVIGLENYTFFEVLEEIRKILIPGVPLTLLLVLAGSWFLAQFVMKPVITAAKKADKITFTNLEQRLPEYTGKDEFGSLVITLNRMIARIEAGVKQIRQFTQDAAHELRTPLTIQRGELELLYEQENLSEESRAAIQKALDRAISMGKIVNNLLLLAQSDTGGYPVQRQQFRLDEVLKETVEDAQNLTEDRPLTIKLNTIEPVDFLGDVQLIRQLLLNLSDNALKYTPQGYIEFGIYNFDDHVEIFIHDSGIGIPKAALPRIFDRFYQVEKSRNSQLAGSGLGLAICQWIVNAHNGGITLSSEPGKGTRINIQLPHTK